MPKWKELVEMVVNKLSKLLGNMKHLEEDGLATSRKARKNNFFITTDQVTLCNPFSLVMMITFKSKIKKYSCILKIV